MSDWILAIDTSTEACSCALGNAESSIYRYIDVPRKHAEKVLPMVDELMSEAAITRGQLNAIAFGRGPGAFTGLRIAASAVQGLAFALDVPVIPISSLQALAQRADREFGDEFTFDSAIAAIDARMGEIYWGVFGLGDQGLMVPVGEEQLTAPINVSLNKNNQKESDLNSVIGIGTGWQYQNQMGADCIALKQVKAECFTHALDVLNLSWSRYRSGDMESVEKALPVYLRNNVAHKPSKT
ncbi:MAG: tRNA (adenosine(37)-N6)-threonylcarbamoyltransferase complex dimerization subunit type 1 TsaB [Pseudomonadales bacterium]|nr:tRNA (adenosine(37)-N6)-threonylcarbamoyltransferase complex dimerization subunit type 1 TsaB [Pseudomonadales bacterium]